MGRIYLNNDDKEILIRIKDKLTNKEEKETLSRLLEQEETSRIRVNKVASIYKKKRREENKMYARSKKEIEKYNERKERVWKKQDFSLK